jgi:hypothetical protein
MQRYRALDCINYWWQFLIIFPLIGAFQASPDKMEKTGKTLFVENRFWLKTCPPDTKEKILRTLCERERYRPSRRVLSGFPCQIGEEQSGLV